MNFPKSGNPSPSNTCFKIPSRWEVQPKFSNSESSQEHLFYSPGRKHACVWFRSEKIHKKWEHNWHFHSQLVFIRRRDLAIFRKEKFVSFFATFQYFFPPKLRTQQVKIAAHNKFLKHSYFSNFFFFSEKYVQRPTRIIWPANLFVETKINFISCKIFIKFST